MPYFNRYKGVPSACGIAFATENGYSNPSLKNLQKELKNDLGEEIDNSLGRWLKEGVLLLNTSLTVEEGLPGGHIGIWREFSKEFLQTMNRVKPNMVYMLLGLYAQSYQTYLADSHCIIAPHPSPLSRGFIGSAVYSKTNELLEKLKQEEIKW